MPWEVKPLEDAVRDCTIKLSALQLERESVSKLEEIVLLAARWFRQRPDKIDNARALLWEVNIEFTRRGIAPRFRHCMGPVPTRVDSLLHAAMKHDAPYYDLQWLVCRYREQPLPKSWRPVLFLPCSHPSSDPAQVMNSSHPDDIDAPWLESESSFEAVARIVRRQKTLPSKIRMLKLTDHQQVGMRVFCRRVLRERIRELTVQSRDVRDRLVKARIPQLKSADIERRILFWQAWKFVGGGTRWQAAADMFGMMTGDTVTRQGMKDMIERMEKAGAVRRRKRRRTKIK